MRHLPRYLFLFVLVQLTHALYSQPNWNYKGYFNFGCNLNLTYRKSQQFPGLRVYAAFIASGIYKKHLAVNYGPSLSVYTRSLGSNLNPLTGDVQVDLTNSFSIGGTWGKELAYTKFFKTINTGSFYNIATNKKYGGWLSTNFILNNHKRNQIVGSVSFSTPDFSINYYNDGASPFDFLPLADNFDRWWTGGFGVYIHNHKNYNTAELSFDQFTGYSSLFYELSSLIGINLPDYNVEDSATVKQKGKLTPAFNTSAYNLKIFPGRGYAIDAGVLGSLRTKAGRVFGLQEIIHTTLGFPLHPNNDINRFYIGGTYNNMRNVRL